MLLSCLSTSCMPTTQPPAPDMTQPQTLEQFFYPAPAGAAYHPRMPQTHDVRTSHAPPQWPPHEHMLVDPLQPPQLHQIR